MNVYKVSNNKISKNIVAKNMEEATEFYRQAYPDQHSYFVESVCHVDIVVK